MTINTFQLFKDKGIFKKIHFYYFSLLNCNIDIMRHLISFYDFLDFFETGSIKIIDSINIYNLCVKYRLQGKMFSH